MAKSRRTPDFKAALAAGRSPVEARGITISAGLRRTQAAGRHIGRPFDVEKAARVVALIRASWPRDRIMRELGIGKSMYARLKRALKTGAYRDVDTDGATVGGRGADCAAFQGGGDGETGVGDDVPGERG